MNVELVLPPPREGSLSLPDEGYETHASHYSIVKTMIDRVAALTLLAASAPLILLLMFLIKVTSRGPALYTQVRLGARGRPYRMVKLRSMFHDCERLSGPLWSTAGDPRVTPLGRFLRRSHLDELPQLWNVLRGEMSLVGPRPERPEFVAQLQRVIPDYRVRLLVRPGITGLAQIQLPPDENFSGVRLKVAYDAYYIRRIGAWLDLRILLGTALKMAGAPFGLIRVVLNLPEPRDVAGTAEVRDVAERPNHSLATVTS